LRRMRNDRNFTKSSFLGNYMDIGYVVNIGRTITYALVKK